MKPETAFLIIVGCAFLAGGVEVFNQLSISKAKEECDKITFQQPPASRDKVAAACNNVSRMTGESCPF